VTVGREDYGTDRRAPERRDCEVPIEENRDVIAKGGAERRTLLPLWAGLDHEAMAAYRLAHRDWPPEYKAKLGRPLPDRRPGTFDQVGEADLVVEMAQRIDAGETLYQILKDFGDRGIKTKTGKKWMEVGTGSIRAIVTAERNIGWKRHLQLDYNPVTDEVEIAHQGMEPADWPPILDRDLYDRVCQKLDPEAETVLSADGQYRKRRTATGNQLKYWLIGKMPSNGGLAHDDVQHDRLMARHIRHAGA